MRASELLGREVVAASGQVLGRVTDIVASVDAPSSGQLGTVRISALLVSPRHTGTFLGYQQAGQRGPWLVRVVVERLHRRSMTVAWAGVESYDGPRIVLRDDPAVDRRAH